MSFSTAQLHLELIHIFRAEMEMGQWVSDPLIHDQITAQ